MRYWIQLATEQFPPSDLVRHRALEVYGESVLPSLRGARV
jgi:hypothetical protein